MAAGELIHGRQWPQATPIFHCGITSPIQGRCESCMSPSSSRCSSSRSVFVRASRLCCRGWDALLHSALADDAVRHGHHPECRAPVPYYRPERRGPFRGSSAAPLAGPSPRWLLSQVIRSRAPSQTWRCGLCRYTSVSSTWRPGSRSCWAAPGGTAPLFGGHWPTTNSRPCGLPSMPSAPLVVPASHSVGAGNDRRCAVHTGPGGSASRSWSGCRGFAV